jgi:hypothetical protein
MTTSARLAIGAGVVLLAAIGVLLILRPWSGGSGMASPSPTASASASGSSASTVPSPASSDELLAAFAEIEAQVLAVRGLQRVDIGPPDLLTRDQLRAELERDFDAEFTAEERSADNLTLQAMGLITPEEDIADLQLQLLGDQVLGFYDQDDERMAVVTDAGLTPEARFTYAHEYTHALQWGSFDSDLLEIDLPGADDQALARLSLIEGDASLSMLLWAVNGGLTQQELQDMATTPTPDTSGIPGWMVASLEFPYTAGLEWTLQVAGGDIFSVDFSAVDEALGDPPDSTEQILHLEKWEVREPPIEVPGRDVAAALGAGWEEVESSPQGEATIAIILEFHGLESADAANAAAGWGGDRLVAASGPDGAFALHWSTEWDTANHADEFEAAYTRALDAIEVSGAVRRTGPTSVTITHASSQDLVDRLGTE